MNYRTFHNIGFRAAESHHQATVDKLMEIISKMKESMLSANYDAEFSIGCEQCVNNNIINSDLRDVLTETDKMMKELKGE